MAVLPAILVASVDGFAAVGAHAAGAPRTFRISSAGAYLRGGVLRAAKPAERLGGGILYCCALIIHVAFGA